MSSTVVPPSRSSRTNSQVSRRPFGVEPGRRLVEEEHLGAAEQRERQVEAPPLTPGQLLDPYVGPPLEPDELQRLRRGPGPAGAARPHPHGLRDGQLGGEAALLEHHADPGPYGGPLGYGSWPEDPHPAAGRRREPLQQFDRRGLARAVGAQQREDLPAAHGEGDPAHRLEPAPVHAPQVSDLDHVFVFVACSMPSASRRQGPEAVRGVITRT